MSDDGDREEWTEAPRKGGLITALGVTNLVFGFACGCLGALYGCAGFVLPGWFDAMGQTLSTAFEARRAGIVAQLDAAEAEIAAAPEGSEDATAAQASRDGLELQLQRFDRDNPVKPLQAMREFFNGPAILGMILGYASIALLWNVGLIVAAFGLFGRRAWARTFMLGLAGTKLLLEIGFGVLVVSTFPEAMNRMFEAMPTGAGGPSAAQIAQIRSGMQMQGLLQGAMGSILGSVYPAAVLIVLMLRSVRQEFSDWAQFRAGSGRG